jgi:hypothetical protein
MGWTLEQSMGPNKFIKYIHFVHPTCKSLCALQAAYESRWASEMRTSRKKQS